MNQVTKKEIHDAYQVLNAAKLGGIKSEDKPLVLNFLRQLRKVDLEYEQDWKYIESKLKPEGFDTNFTLAVQYEQALKDRKPVPEDMSKESYNAFKEEYLKYRSEFSAAMREEDAMCVEINTEGITPELLSSLMSINDWTVEQYFTIENLINL